jgi:hypothetical protein
MSILLHRQKIAHKFTIKTDITMKERYCIRFDKDELEKIKRFADKAQMSVSKYVRKSAYEV